MGRPPKLTAALVELVAADIGKGMTHRLACARHGVNYNTWASAILKHPEFSLAVDEQNAEWLYNALGVISLGLPGDTGLRWLAERRFKEFQKTEVHVEAHVTNQFQTVTPEVQERLAAIAREHFTKPAGGRN